MRRLSLQNLLLILCPLIIYFPSFRYFFFQDDFYHLRITMIQSLQEFLSFFIPSDQVIYYRPLPIQLYFYFTRLIFGLNPLAFRLIAFFFFVLDIFLVKKTIKKITGNDCLSFSVAFLFGISSIHFMSLFWISAFSIVLGASFFFLSFLYFPRKKALIFLFLGLLSHDLMISLPMLLLFYEWVFQKVRFKKILPFFLLVIFYFAFRIFLFPIPIKGTYQPELGTQNISAFMWYFLWGFNLPEELKYQAFFFIIPRIKFIFDFANDFLVWTILFLIISVIFFVIPLLSFKKLIFTPKTKKFLIFGIAWFLLIVFLLVFNPQHQYPMYLTFALPGFYLALITWLVSFLENFKKELKEKVIWFSLLFFFLLSWETIEFNQRTHWVVIEAARAKAIIEIVLDQFPEKSETLKFILPDSFLVKTSLNDQDAFKIYYGEEAEVFYGATDKFIKNKDQEKDFKIVNLPIWHYSPPK